MATPVTFAIVGAGSRGLFSYGKYIEEHQDDARVVAVAEPREWHRAETARRHRIGNDAVTSHWKDLIAQPKIADAVIVSTQDRDHHAPVLAFLEKGYHVLLEKPMSPSLQECQEITAAAQKSGSVFAVCHVLRYTPYFRKMKEFIESAVLGQITLIRHMEQVGYWHFSHSYVRGNWRKEETAAPLLMAKCCHDIDIILYLMNKKCLRVSSFGNLSHFTSARAPKEATDRCVSCPLAESMCPYSATKFYMGKFKSGDHGWPLDVITTDMTEHGVMNALQQGPYGRCVYHCDNNVVDHQMVQMELEDGILADFIVNAFSYEDGRRTEIFGSHGELRADGRVIRVKTYDGKISEEFDSAAAGNTLADGHMGGDGGLMSEFITAVQTKNPAAVISGPAISFASHNVVFAAERARHSAAVVMLS